MVGYANSGKYLSILFSIVFSTTYVHATVSLSNLFSNGMVLQRNMRVPVWGKAASGESVTVTFNGQTKTAITTANGTWKVLLDSMRAGGPFAMTITGTSAVTVSDVYVGEVWQCAGQSNMDTRVSYYPHYATVQNSYNNKLLRFFTLRQSSANKDGFTTNQVWKLCTSSASNGSLSCLGFFFGKQLQERLDTVAVGLIVTAVGGTTIASWLDSASLSTHPDIAQNDASAGTMYSSWIAPVAGCALKGTVFIQGEQDRSASLAPYYKDRFPMLINGWRKVWGVGDFSFYWLQLANYGTLQTTAASGGGTTADIREVQRLGLSLCGTGMAVAIDIGDSLHFGNKQEGGRRLALIARARDYGEDTLVFSGPLFINMSIEGSKIHCRFIHTGGGISTSDQKTAAGFAICGADKQWVWADAVIHNDTVTVSSAQVKNPLYVRYAYAGNPVANLCNKEGLPASPFTTEGPQLVVNVKEESVAAVGHPVLNRNTQGRCITVDACGRTLLYNAPSALRVVYRNNWHTGEVRRQQQLQGSTGVPVTGSQER